MELKKQAKKFGDGSHVILPKKLLGQEVTIIIAEETPKPINSVTS